MADRHEHHHHHHHHQYKESDPEKIMQKALFNKKNRTLFSRILFNVLCVIAAIIVLFVIWAYTN